ncbi:unnamed protein product [Dracunculus medinensis]|uniref:PAP2_C domain-containing protein n=1 Tax=Dracunculus medinensis TaxID=318479 RepID=A0A0N4U3R9_DRAME|nr:unnamed protein product [Dracunculus medinensis]
MKKQDDDTFIINGESNTIKSRRICNSLNSSEDSSEDNCALLILVIIGFFNDFVLSVVHERVPEQPPLPDIVFERTPYIPQALVFSEYLILISLFIMLLITIFHKYRWIILRRIACIGSLLYFGRCVTILATQVPVADSNYYCSPKFKDDNYTFWNVFLRSLQIVGGVGLKINGKHTLCGDYIYSGHTIVFVISCLFIREYSPRRWKPLHFLSILISMVGVILLLISRGHYTIDVIISYWISTRIFWIYHTLAACSNLRVILF